MSVQEINTMCLQRKGRGNNFFCLRKNCRISHQGERIKIPVLPGEGYVKKDSVSAFCEPVLNLGLLEDDLLEEITKASHTLDEWAEVKRMVEKKVDVADRENKISMHILVALIA